MAEQLSTSGISANDVVAIMLPNRVELVLAIFAAWRLGAAATPINPAFTATEADFQIADSGAKLTVNSGPDSPAAGLPTIHVADLATEASRPIAAREVSADELALLVYTSGSTGKPKGVMSGWLLAAVVAALLFFPILGNLRPDLVSFLPSMRQYAGNWMTGTWAFRGDAEKRMGEMVHPPSRAQVDQLAGLFGPEVAEIFMHKVLAWRTMHSQGRALISLMMRHVDDVENYTLREGEFTCSNLLGWQFGDGHLYDERLLAAVQARCNFEPGELVAVYVESQPIHKPTQQYRVVDAALGEVERGWYVVKDATEEQPWLPNGPIKHTVSWTAPGYVAPEWHGHNAGQGDHDKVDV